MRWRSLLVFCLSMCELEVMEGTMGQFFGLVTLFFRCIAVTVMGDLLSYSKKKMASYFLE